MITHTFQYAYLNYVNEDNKIKVLSSLLTNKALNCLLSTEDSTITDNLLKALFDHYCHIKMNEVRQDFIKPIIDLIKSYPDIIFYCYLYTLTYDGDLFNTNDILSHKIKTYHKFSQPKLEEWDFVHIYNKVYTYLTTNDILNFIHKTDIHSHLVSFLLYRNCRVAIGKTNFTIDDIVIFDPSFPLGFTKEFKYILAVYEEACQKKARSIFY